MDHPAILLTTNGWISGNLYLPLETDTTCAYLEQEWLLKLTDVLLEESCSVGQLYSVRTQAVSLIALNGSSAAFSMPAPTPGCRWVTIHLRLSAGNLCGELELPKNLRFADFLERENHWFAMQDCWIQSSFEPDPRPDGTNRWPLVLVNSGAIVGFSDDVVL